jgi:hypothetical protein
MYIQVVRLTVSQLARNSHTVAQFNESSITEVHALISKTADAYQDASILSPASSSAAAHARFLRSLVARDMCEHRENEKERFDSMSIDPRLQPGKKDYLLLNATDFAMQVSSSRNSVRSNPQHSPHSQTSHPMYPSTMPRDRGPPFTYPAPSQVPSHVPHPHEASSFSSDSPVRSNGPDTPGPMAHLPHPQYTPSPSSASAPPPSLPQHASEQDAYYWKSMLMELGFGENEHGAAVHPNAAPGNDVRSLQYADPHPQHLAQHPSQQHRPHQPPHQPYAPPPLHQPISAHPMHHSQPPYRPVHTTTQVGYSR